MMIHRQLGGSPSFVTFCLLLVLFCIFPDMAQGQQANQPLTLEEAVRIAMEENLELKVREQDIGMARGELLKAKVFLNPEFEIQGATDALISNENESNFAVGLSQTFFLGPKRQYRIGIAELDIKQTHRTIENSRRILAARVKEVFYTILLFREKQALAEELIEINQRLVRLTKGRFREGFSAELDVNLARIQLQEARSERTQIEKDLAVARASFNLLIGRPAPSTLVIQGEFADQKTPIDLAQLGKTALIQRPDLKGLDTAVTLFTQQVDLEKAERIPDVTVSLGYAQEDSIFHIEEVSDRDQFLGLTLSVPIPFFNRNQGEIVQARVRQERASLERNRLRAEIEKEITNAAIRVEVAYQTFTLYRDGILPLAKEHFGLSEKAYERGQARILDVMEAQRRFSQARLGYLGALFEYNLALVKMEQAVGTGLDRP